MSRPSEEPMSCVAIVSAAIAPADAVGHDIRHMRRILSARGHAVELFALHPSWPDPRTPDGRTVHAFLGDDPSAILLYHHAIGWDAAVGLLVAARCRRVVRYHNVTPAHFYESLNPTLAIDCRRGREQLRDLAGADCDLYLSDSAYNQKELLEAGADPARCVVVPPFHHLDRLAAVEPDPEVLRDAGDGLTNLLFVGRRSPQKGHRFLLDAFAAYHRHYNPLSRLLLVGKGDPFQPAYSNALREQVRRLGLQGSVTFVDGASESELRAYYAAASAFVLASEHEGFCVPAVEAMALGVPVVAYGTTAVPDTVGDAGLLWDEPDPFLLAQSIDGVVRDPALRQRLTERGRRRYRERFSNRQTEHAFLDALRSLAA